MPFIRNYLKWNIQNWTSRLPLWITIIDQRNLPSFLVVKEHLLSWLKAEAGFYSISALPGLAISKTRVCWDVDKSSCSTRLEQTQKMILNPVQYGAIFLWVIFYCKKTEVIQELCWVWGYQKFWIQIWNFLLRFYNYVGGTHLRGCFIFPEIKLYIKILITLFSRENFHNFCQKFLINPRYDELKIDMERECKSDYPTEDHPSVN